MEGLNVGVFQQIILLLIVTITHHIGIQPCLSDSCSITGVSPNECNKYEAKERVFYCGGKENRRIPMKYVNDDYCDCIETGADEPGTSACINGEFYCNNKGFRGRKVFSSWVNDGKCDCCDGSDEWQMIEKGRVSCPNTCKQLAEEELKGVRQQKRKYEEGLKARAALIARGQEKIDEKHRSLTEIQAKIDDLQTRTEIARVKKEDLEEKERKYKDELKEKRAQEKAKQQEEQQQQQQQSQEENNQRIPEPGQDDTQDKKQVPPEPIKKENTEEGDDEFPYPDEYRPPPGDEEEGDDEFPYPEEYRYHSEDEKGNEEGDDGFDWSEFEDEDDMPYPDDIMDDESNEDDIPYDPLLEDMQTAAKTARSEWKDLDRELRNLKRDLSDAEGIDTMNFGSNNEFVSLYDECFSSDINKYTYEFCPFNIANQKEKHSTIKLGKYDKFEIGNSNDINSKTIMYFNHGQSCWKGPQRSLKVIFECDSVNKILSVSEPSTCTYEMSFSTPLACTQAHVDQLDNLINNQFKQEL